MTVREKLFSEVATLCKDIAFDSTKVNQELSGFIGDDEVVDYCITQGPLPTFPDVVFDIMVLSNKYIHDYEMKQQGALHHLLPLKAVIEIGERFEKLEDEEYLSVSFKASALGTGLLFQGKLSDSKDIRRFSSAVARKMIEST